MYQDFQAESQELWGRSWPSAYQVWDVKAQLQTPGFQNAGFKLKKEGCDQVNI